MRGGGEAGPGTNTRTGTLLIPRASLCGKPAIVVTATAVRAYSTNKQAADAYIAQGNESEGWYVCMCVQRITRSRGQSLDKTCFTVWRTFGRGALFHESPLGLLVPNVAPIWWGLAFS